MFLTTVRDRIGTSFVSALLGVVMALGLTGVLAPATAAHGMSPLELCLLIFPNGISASQATEAALQGSGLTPGEIAMVVSAASAGDMTCYDLFGGAPPVDPTVPPVDPTVPPVDPTVPPVDPTAPPVDPTAPAVDPTTAPMQPTTAPAEPTTGSHSGTTEATKSVTVTTMPSTGSGAGPSSGLPAVGLLTGLAVLLAAVAGVTLRATAVRAPRR